MSKALFVDPKEVRKTGKISFQDIPVCTYNRTIQEERANFSDDDLIRIWRDMSVIREFESMLQSIKTLGSYNGNDKKVMNLTISSSERIQYAGLFGCVRGKIENPLFELLIVL